MAATAQDSLAPLRSGEGKKDEDREEESTLGNSASAVPTACRSLLLLRSAYVYYFKAFRQLQSRCAATAAYLNHR
jgi:hypothetical protein